MLIHKIAYSFSFLLLAAGASAQTVPGNIDKAHKDPKTAGRAARADVLMPPKAIMADSVAAAEKVASIKDTAVQQKPAASQKGKKKAKKKR